MRKIPKHSYVCKKKKRKKTFPAKNEGGMKVSIFKWFKPFRNKSVDDSRPPRPRLKLTQTWVTKIPFFLFFFALVDLNPLQLGRRWEENVACLCRNLVDLTRHLRTPVEKSSLIEISKAILETGFYKSLQFMMILKSIQWKQQRNKLFSTTVRTMMIN